MMWNKTELNILKKHYKVATFKEIHKLLPGKTKRAIQIKASREGLTKPYKDRNLGYSDSISFLANFSEFERGYLAGIIDGEGCICFTRSKSSSGRFVYRLQLTIVNTSVQLKQWLDSKLFGHGYIIANWRKACNKREVWSWTVSGPKRTIKFLREIIPYLVIKKQQASLLLNGYVHLNEADRDSLFHQVRELKHVT